MDKILIAAGTWPGVALFWLLSQGAGVSPMASAALALLYAGIYMAAAVSVDRAVKLDYAVVFFFAAGLALSGLDADAGRMALVENGPFFLMLCLFLAALLPVIFGAEPFTMAYARRTTPEIYWQTELFRKINKLMTLAWAVLFLLAAVIALLPGIFFRFLLPAALLAGLGIPFNRRFPDWYMQRIGLPPLADQPDTGRKNSGPSHYSQPSETIRPSGQEARPQKDQDASRAAAVCSLPPIRKILVIQGSPRGKAGRTDECLQRFLEGTASAGAETETVYLNRLEIKPCTGCYTCWTKTPGHCIHRDDMPDLLEKLRNADLVVHAFPLYVFTIPGLAKNFLDRCLPLAKPHIITGPDGLSAHPKEQEGPARLLLLSVCGFPEPDHFRALNTMYDCLTAAGGSILIGRLLRPGAEGLPAGRNLGTVYDQVMEAFRKAGSETIEQGYVSRSTEEAASTPLFRDNDLYRLMANLYWDAEIAYHEAKRSGREMPPLKDYLAGLPQLTLAGMAVAFNPEAAGDLEAVIQFDISGPEPGWHYLEIKGGRCRYQEGRAEAPSVTIHTPWEVWQAIGQGELSGQEAFMKGSYTVEGDLGLLMKMAEYFRR